MGATGLALLTWLATAWTAVPVPAPTWLKAGADFSGVWELKHGNGPAHFDQDADFRHPNPPLTPEWLAEWQKTSERKRAGMKIWDPAIHCLPPGMPHTMNGTYPMEVLMTPGRVTVLTELFNETRRIWTDGRGHPPPDELEYTFVGDSIGHWEGDTLVIDTVGVREESVLDVTDLPHSDQMHLTERVHLANKNQLDWTITLIDPVVYARPWTVTKHYLRAKPDEKVREYVCAENNQAEPYTPSTDDAKYDRPDPRLKTRE
jgi:hypothetical protein